MTARSSPRLPRPAEPATAAMPHPRRGQHHHASTEADRAGVRVIATVRSLRSPRSSRKLRLVTRLREVGRPRPRRRTRSRLTRPSRGHRHQHRATRAGTEADVNTGGRGKTPGNLWSGRRDHRQEFDQPKLTAHGGGAAGRPRCASRGGSSCSLPRGSPAAGIIGDTDPHRDRVTTSTVITTVDETGALEVYIQIPLDRSPTSAPASRCSSSTGWETGRDQPDPFVARRVTTLRDRAGQERAQGSAPLTPVRSSYEPASVAEQAGLDGAGDRGIPVSGSTSASSPTRRRGCCAATAGRGRRVGATTTWSRAV